MHRKKIGMNEQNHVAAQEELRRSFMGRRLAKEKEEKEDEEKHALEQELHTATVAMWEEIASLADQYPLQLHDFAQKDPLKQGDREHFVIHFAGPLAGCPPAVRNKLRTSFQMSKGRIGRGRIPRRLIESFKIMDDDVRIEWNLDINPNGQPLGETQRAIQRWAPTTDDGKYEYRTWCFARATNNDLEKDLNNRIESRLQQLADSLSFAKRKFASLAGEGRSGREIQERKVAKIARHRQLHRDLMAKLKAMMEPFESGAKPATAQSVKNTFKNLEMKAILKCYYSIKEGVSSMNEDAMAEAIANSIVVVQPTETTVAAPRPAPHAASDVAGITSDN